MVLGPITERRVFESDFVDKKSNIKIGKDTILEYGVVIYDNCEIGQNSLIGTNAVLRPGTKIGDHSIFGSLSMSEGDCKIGSWTTIHAQCHITQGVEIGDRVFIAPFFIASNTPFIGKTGSKFGFPNTTNMPRKPTKIEDGVRMGVCVSLAPGITIGKDSIIDQNCLITKDIPPGSHVRASKEIIGRKIGDVSELEKRLNL